MRLVCGDMEYFCLRFCQISNDNHSSLHSVAPSSVPGGEGFDRSSPRRDDVSRVSQASGERISRALRWKDEPASMDSSPTAANFPPRPPAPGVCQLRGPTLDARRGVTFLVDSSSGPRARRRALPFWPPQLPSPAPRPRYRPTTRDPRAIIRLDNAATPRGGTGNISLSLSILFFSFHRARSYSTSTVPPRRPRDILSPAVHPPSNAERHDEHGLNL